MFKNVQLQIVKKDRVPGSPTFGEDLDVIDVYGPDAGIGVCLLSGFSGLAHAPRTHVKESWAYQEGVTLSQFPRVEERTFDMRLATKAASPDEWVELEDRLWRALTFDDDAVLRVTTATSTREINCRLDRKPDDAMTMFPGETLFMVWSITLLAADPWWYSEELTSSWTRGSAVADGSGWYSGTVTIENPADQICWLEWSNREIEVAETWMLADALGVYPAGHTSAGQNILHALPELGVGKSFLVNTYPLEETLKVMDNSLEWAKMRAAEFTYSVPAENEPVIVPVKLKGGTVNSKVTVFMPQRHDRPW